MMVSMSVHSSVHIYVPPKKLFLFERNLVCRWAIHDRTPYNLIQGQGQGHGGPKVMKTADIKVYLLYWYACKQKTNGELW